VKFERLTFGAGIKRAEGAGLVLLSPLKRDEMATPLKTKDIALLGT
jgi:hypothetical protein